MKWPIYILIFVVLSAIAYLGYDYAETKQENKHLKANQKELLYENETLVTNLNLTQKELSEFVKIRFPALKAKIDSANIRSRTIEKIVVQKVIYKDTTSRKTDLKPVVEAIQKGIYIKEPFADISHCMIIRGFVEYDGKKMNITISDREFKSINQAVSYWERKQWKLWFIKSRWFGKKEIKVTVFNSCGESKTVVVNRKE